MHCPAECNAREEFFCVDSAENGKTPLVLCIAPGACRLRGSKISGKYGGGLEKEVLKIIGLYPNF